MGVPDDFENVLDFQVIAEQLAMQPKIEPGVYAAGTLSSIIEMIDGRLSLVRDRVNVCFNDTHKRQVEAEKAHRYFRWLAKRLQEVHHALQNLKELLDKGDEAAHDIPF